MIDSTGKKIGEDSEKPDKEFLLAEIKFFLKGFSNNKTDNKASAYKDCRNTASCGKSVSYTIAENKK